MHLVQHCGHTVDLAIYHTEGVCLGHLRPEGRHGGAESSDLGAVRGGDLPSQQLNMFTAQLDLVLFQGLSEVINTG